LLARQGRSHADLIAARCADWAHARSSRRKSTPFRSAMSMLNFYENRGGRNLSASARKKLDGAKSELRKLFHKGD
jgi:hypothetical protein